MKNAKKKENINAVNNIITTERILYARRTGNGERHTLTCNYQYGLFTCLTTVHLILKGRNGKKTTIT